MNEDHNIWHAAAAKNILLSQHLYSQILLLPSVVYECIFAKVTIYSDSRYQGKKIVVSTLICFAIAVESHSVIHERSSAVPICLKHVSQEGYVSINDFPQFLPGERKFRTDIHPACMDERGRVFVHKQMFCLMWDFKFDHSREMDKKY